MDGNDVAVDMVRTALPCLAPSGTMVLYSGAPVFAGCDLLRSALAPFMATSGHPARYEEIDADVFGDELQQHQNAHVERLAVVSLTVGPINQTQVSAFPESPEVP